MKQIFCAFAILALSLSLFTDCALADGVTVSLGANAMYSAWQPPWAGGRIMVPPYYFGLSSPAYLTPGRMVLTGRSVPVTINRFKNINGPLAGPSLSIFFLGRWSIASIFLAGKYVTRSTGPVARGVTMEMIPYLPAPALVVFISSRYRRDITRYDSDSTVGCKINDHLKLFLGFKYQGYRYNESSHYVTQVGAGLVTTGRARFNSYGGGLGLGVTAPLYRGLYLLVNLSGLAMYGDADYKYNKFIFYDPTSSVVLPLPCRFTGDRYWGAGGNATASFAYVFGQSGITLALGFRYQALYYFWQKNNPRGFLDYYGRLDHFYGGTFSLTYSFTIGRKTGGES